MRYVDASVRRKLLESQPKGRWVVALRSTEFFSHIVGIERPLVF